MKVLLVGSIVVLSVLFLGYFGFFGVSLTRNYPAGISPTYKSTQISLDSGRVRIWTEVDMRPAPHPHNRIVRRWIEWDMWRPRLPDIKRSIWEFDNHRIVGSKAIIQARIFAFPIWCVALPFLIAPTICLRRRLKNRRDPEGFSVVELAAGNAAS